MKFTVVYKKVSERYIGFVKELPGAPHFLFFLSLQLVILKIL